MMLSAAVATWLLTFAYDYPTFLLAALGVGIAGGSFAVGIAYVSQAGIPKEKQGTALGIFGAGNVGAAVTKFVAPFIMVAYGWKTVAKVWALAHRRDGRRLLAAAPRTTRSSQRGAAAAPSRAARGACWSRCKNLQVWRFSLYYFFVFGAFVALALWLPRYLIGVYGLDITHRRHDRRRLLACRRACSASTAAHLSDKYGARRVMYWTFGVSVASCSSCCPTRRPTTSCRASAGR